MPHIHMTIGDDVYTVELSAGNDAAADFMARLPITMHFEDFGANERISYFERKLMLGQAPTSTAPARGDVCYYSPWGNLAVFVRPFRRSEGLVPLGRMSEAALEALRTCSDKPVVFSKAA